MPVSEIVLNWNANVPAVQGYNIYRGTTIANVPKPGSMPLNGAVLITSPTYTDLNVFPGKVYVYAVTAVNGGVESLDSLFIISAPVPFPFSPNGPTLLASLDNFEVLAGSTVTNTGNSTIAGDVGVYPGSSIVGFPPGIIAGVLHSADFVAAQGQVAALDLFNKLVAYTSTATISGDIGGTTFAPGVYTSSSTVGITGVLTLDAGGNPNAVFIFQVGSALTTSANNSQVVLLNGAQASNVYWVCGSSATLGTATTFVGTIVAQASISANTGASIDGRLLALTGAVTLQDNAIILFNAAPFVPYDAGVGYSLGEVMYDCATGLFWEVTQAGITGASRPAFVATPGVFVIDGTVQWFSVSPVGVILNLPLPPSPPNVAPAPPSAPTGLHISLEQ